MPREPNRSSIAQVCEQTGLSARTVRYYEELGLLPNVHRHAGGRRVYGPDEVERLFFIQRLKALGLSLAEIKELNAVYSIAGSTREMLTHLDRLLANRLADLDRRIKQLEDLRGEILAYGSHVKDRIKKAKKTGAGP